jgi:nicotinamidase-related amidase
MFAKQLGKRAVNLAHVVVDMQNGFVSPESSYAKLGMNISHYCSIIPRIRELMVTVESKAYPYSILRR